jgi:hypothetical protein
MGSEPAFSTICTNGTSFVYGAGGVKTDEKAHVSVAWFSPSLFWKRTTLSSAATASHVPDRETATEEELPRALMSENSVVEPTLKGKTPGPAGFQASEFLTRTVQQRKLLSIAGIPSSL